MDEGAAGVLKKAQAAFELLNPSLGFACVVEAVARSGGPVVEGLAGAVPLAHVEEGVTEGEDGVKAGKVVAADLVDAAPVDDTALDVVEAIEEKVEDTVPVGVIDVGFVGADQDALGALEGGRDDLVVAKECGGKAVDVGEGDACGVKELGLEPQAVAVGLEVGAPGGEGAAKPGVPDGGLGGGGGDEELGVGGQLGGWRDDFEGRGAGRVADEEGASRGLVEVEPLGKGLEGEWDAVGLGGGSQRPGVEAGEVLAGV